MDINISINVTGRADGEHLPVNIEAFAQDLLAQGIDVRVSGPDSRLLSERLAAFDPHDDGALCVSDLKVFAREAARLEDLLLREQAYVEAGERKIQELRNQNRAYQAPPDTDVAAVDHVAELRTAVEHTMTLLGRAHLAPDEWTSDRDTLSGLRIKAGKQHRFAVVVALSKPPGNYCVVATETVMDGSGGFTIQDQDSRFTDDLDDVRAWLIDWAVAIVNP